VQNSDFLREMWATVLAGTTWHGELSTRRKDGSLYAEETTLTPVRDETGQVAHFVAIRQDVSARKTDASRAASQ
jgi:PAS domain S-box-containing protein